MATLDEIAERAGVSRDTVARALSGRTKQVWPSTVQRVALIRRIARELGWRPNSAARAIALGRFNAVALILSTEKSRSNLPDNLLCGILDALTEQRCHLIISRFPDEKLASEQYVPRILREWAADGMLVDYTREIPAKMLQVITANGLPCIWLNTRQESDCVYPDEQAGSRNAAAELIRLGHRRLGYACFSLPHDRSSPHFSIAERRAGFERALREAGLSPGAVHGPISQHRNEDPLFCRRWLSQPSSPTAVLTYSMREASAMLLAAKELQLRVPEDLSIVTFRGEDVGSVGGVMVSAVLIPEYEMGKEAVAMLTEKLDDASLRLNGRALEMPFQACDTSGPPGGVDN